MRISAFLTALSLGLLPAAALAQGSAAPAGGTPSPQATGAGAVTDTKAVGDWTVRCFSVQSQSPCDMYEELQDQNSHQRVLGVSIAYIPAQDRHVAQIAVPLGVAIQSGVQIKTDTYLSPKFPFRRCDQAGCYAELVLDPSVVDGLSKSGPQASVNIVADDGKSYALRFSLNGFAGAHDAMQALAKQKATSAPAAGAPAAAPKKK